LREKISIINGALVDNMCTIEAHATTLDIKEGNWSS